LIGPIVLEDASSTRMIPEGAVARCDAPGNVIVDQRLVEQTQEAVTLAKTG
jgi:hypothetical protein